MGALSHPGAVVGHIKMSPPHLLGHMHYASLNVLLTARLLGSTEIFMSLVLNQHGSHTLALGCLIQIQMGSCQVQSIKEAAATL